MGIPLLVVRYPHIVTAPGPNRHLWDITYALDGQRTCIGSDF